MSFGENPPDAALVELALAFHRSPARFPGLRDPAQPLPGDPSVLLKLASGASRDALGLSAAIGREETLQEAALFFVEQVLLAPGADYYRMHGLAPDASEKRIRENHRLLMRTFHPDREASRSGDDWRDGFASRINQAYGVLRDAARRAEYDRTLGASAPGRTHLTRPHLPMHAWSERDLARGTATTPFGRYLWRHLPQLVLGATAVVASVVVALVWWISQPSGAIGGGGMADRGDETLPAAARVAESTAMRALRDAPVPDVPRLTRATDAVEHDPQPLRLSSIVPPADTPTEPGAGQRAVRAPAAPIDAQRATAAPALKAGPTLVLRAVPAGPATGTGVAAEGPASTRVVPMAAAAPAAAPGGRADNPDPTSLVPEFTKRYADGNLAAFMELFDPDARNETGGYAKIRKDYDELFAATSLRQLFVSDMRWTPRNDRLWQGEGNFQARVQRSGETTVRHYDGTIRMEVSTRGDRPTIRVLHHSLADGSR